MNVRTLILPFTKDLRDRDQLCSGAAIEQARADQALEQLWRQRIAANIRRRQAAKTEGASIEHSRSRAA